VDDILGRESKPMFGHEPPMNLRSTTSVPAACLRLSAVKTSSRLFNVNSLCLSATITSPDRADYT
jgi:hypothetical protein